MSWHEITTRFDAVTGGWDSLLQGGAGGLLGIFGAFLIALWTTRHELHRDRENIRNQARVAVVDRLSPVLHDMASHLEYIDDDHLLVDQSWASKRVSAWRELMRRYERQVDEDRALLPDDIQGALADTNGRLDDPYYINDDAPGPVYFEPGDADKAAALKASINTSIDRLNSLRTAIYAPVRIPIYKRLWFAWAAAGVVTLALLVVVLLD